MYLVCMFNIRTIVERLGGPSATARRLGHNHCTTVHGWVTRGDCKLSQAKLLLDVAATQGVDVTPADFFEEEGA